MAGNKFAHCNMQHMHSRQAQYVPHRQFEAPRRTLGAQAHKPQQQTAPAWASRLGSARDAALIQVLLYCALLQTLDYMKELEAERLKAEQVPMQQYEWTDEDLNRFLGRNTCPESHSPCSISTSGNSDTSSSPTSSSGIPLQESSTHVTTCPSTHTAGATQVQPVQQQQQAIIIYQPAPFAALLTLFYAASRAGQHVVAAVADSSRILSSSSNSLLVCRSTALVVSSVLPTISLVSVLYDIIPSSVASGYMQRQQQASMQLSMVRTRRCFILPLSAIVWVLQKRAARRSRRALLKSTPAVGNTALPASSSSNPLVPLVKCGKPQLSITIPDLVLSTPCTTPIILPCLDLLCEEECEEEAVVVEVVVQDSHHSMPGSKSLIKAAAALTSPLSPVKPLDSHPSLKLDDTAAAAEENKLTVNPLTRLLSAISSRGASRGSAVAGVKEPGSEIGIKAIKHTMGSKFNQLVRRCTAALSCSRAPAVAHD